MAAISITKEQFEQSKALDTPVLVDFWAPWCGYCRRIEAAYDRIAEEYRDQLQVVKINVDEEPALTEAERIELIPTLVIYRGGQAIGSVVAPDSKAAIDRFIRDTLQR